MTKFHPIHAPTKENNGKAARKHKFRYLVMLAVFALIVALIIFIMQSNGSNDKKWESLRKLKKTISPADSKHHHRPSQQQQQQYHQYRSQDDILQAIALGELNLVDIVPTRHFDDTSEYVGLMGEFCSLSEAWALHKHDPSSTPMFRDVVNAAGEACTPTSRVSVDLYTAVQHVREYDNNSNNNNNKNTKAHQLELTAVAFHESRCGSTLVANLWQAWDPQGHRVYSESGPPVTALRMCSDESNLTCKKPLETPVQVLRDVIYLMSRSNDEREQRVFFKIQSIGTRQLSVWQRAFSTTPWLFVYRNPVQVLTSQLRHGVAYANCVRPQHATHQAKILSDLLNKYNAEHENNNNVIDHPAKLSATDYCALHLATLTTTAVQHLNEYALPLEYTPDLAKTFTQLVHDRLNLPLDASIQGRLEATAAKYSKGRDGQAREFTQDVTQKEALATDEMRLAAQKFLDESYTALKEASSKIITQQQ